MSKFCTECGTSLNEQEQFCPSCGTKYKVQVQQEQPIQQDVNLNVEVPKRTEAKAPKKPMSIWRKLVISFLLLLVAAGVGGHFFIKWMTAPDKLVQTVYNALLNDDEETFFANISIPENVQYDAKNYMAYIKDQKMNSFLTTLKENTSKTEADGMTRIVQHKDGSDLFRLKSAKFLFFYPVVKIEAISTPVAINTDLSNVNITFHEKEYALEGKKIKLGTFLPGNYTIEATTENEYLPHSANWSFIVTTSEKENNISLMNNELMITIGRRSSR